MCWGQRPTSTLRIKLKLMATSSTLPCSASCLRLLQAALAELDGLLLLLAVLNSLLLHFAVLVGLLLHPTHFTVLNGLLLHPT